MRFLASTIYFERLSADFVELCVGRALVSRLGCEDLNCIMRFSLNNVFRGTPRWSAVVLGLFIALPLQVFGEDDYEMSPLNYSATQPNDAASALPLCTANTAGSEKDPRSRRRRALDRAGVAG